MHCLSFCLCFCLSVCLSVFKMEQLLYNSVNGRFERLLLKECHLKRLCLEMFVYMIKNKLVTYFIKFCLFQVMI